jgi:ATP-dependent Lhr-like helicase
MQAANADSLHDALRALGDLTTDEAQARCLEGVSAARMLDQLRGERRAVAMRIGSEERWIAAEDAGLYRDAFGAVPPGGLPEVFLETVDEPLRKIVRRYARTHGPFTTGDMQRRYLVDPNAVLRELERAGDLVRGELRPGGTEREWCDPEVLRRLRRASLASLRKEVEPAEQRALARLLPSWQGVDSAPPGGAGVDRLREVLVPLQGVALAPEVWERDVLPRRVGAYSPAWMDQLCAGGEIVWIGAGALGRNSGKVAMYFRDDARFLGPPPAKGDRPDGEVHNAIRARLERGASFWSDLIADVDVEPVELQNSLWDLVWAGEVTNDAYAPLRAPRLTLARAERNRAAQRRFGRRRRPAAPQIQGRWSLTAPLFADAPAYGPRARAIGEVLLERYGIVTRETVLAEGLPGGFAALYGELVNLETLGTARRGYFVEGLGGAQFALPGAVERLRAQREESERPLVLAAVDPAQPYGATLPWPRRDDDARRPQRVAGAHVVLAGGEPILFLERSGKGALTLVEPGDPRLRTAFEAVADEVRRGRIRKVALERVDGEPVVGGPFGELLLELGFRQSPRALTLTA